MTREIVLEGESGGHVAKVHILPFPKLPRVVMWGTRLFQIFDEDGVYRECHWATPVPSPLQFGEMAEGKAVQVGPPVPPGSFVVGLNRVLDTPENRAAAVNRRLGAGDVPVHYGDGLVTRSFTVFSFLDRVRILFGKTVHMTIRTKLEFAPGRTMNDFTHVYVEHILPEKNHTMSAGGEEPNK